MSQQPMGVEQTRGMCDDRAGQGPDTAYKVTKQTVLTVPTAQLFKGVDLCSVLFVSLSFHFFVMLLALFYRLLSTCISSQLSSFLIH